MTKMTRFLALVPMVVLAAACNGVAPTGPSELTSNDATALSGGATEMGGPSSRLCTATGIDLRIEGSRTMVWVVATYQYSSPSPVACAAPAWTADRSDLVIDKADAFRAGFARTAEGAALVTATAPNGVHNSIRVNLIGTGDVAERGCLEVSGVKLQIVPITSNSAVSLVATYEFAGPASEGCSIAPSWSASRKGLQVHARDGFRADIAASADDVQTTVSATAPNGVQGTITF